MYQFVITNVKRKEKKKKRKEKKRKEIPFTYCPYIILLKITFLHVAGLFKFVVGIFIFDGLTYVNKTDYKNGRNPCSCRGSRVTHPGTLTSPALSGVRGPPIRGLSPALPSQGFEGHPSGDSHQPCPLRGSRATHPGTLTSPALSGVRGSPIRGLSSHALSGVRGSPIRGLSPALPSQGFEGHPSGDSHQPCPLPSQGLALNKKHFSDEDGIRTHTCRAQWISSPSP